MQSAGQLVRLEPRTLAVVVATTGRLRAAVAGNRTFFYRVHQGLRCLLTRAGSAFEVLVEETDGPCAGVEGGRLVEARPGHPAHDGQHRGDVGWVVVVEEHVSGVGVFLDVVVHPDRGEDPFESDGGASVAPVLLAVAADDGAGAGQELVGVDVLGGGAVVDAGGGETVVRREE